VTVFEPGPLLASGRDADIFEYGPTQVLRRSRNARSMEREARVMEYVHTRGYPIPKVGEVSDDGLELIMERLDGVTMVEALTAAPWKARRFGRTLAQLHVQLHDLSAPEWLVDAPCGAGSQLLHMDLHPLNVMMTSRGPVVIDWTNAARGDPNVDVAVTWTLMSAAEVPISGVKGAMTGWIRAKLIKGFIAEFDVAAVGTEVDAVVEWKCADRNMSESEVAGMRSFARRVQRH
jgi:aminoglycoside phosphotransferase (APT) family kinase protein